MTNFVLNPLRETFVDKIVQNIELRISTGKLKPNSILSEIKVAKDFNVSRGPVREAFFRLEEMGFVEKKHNGRVVKEFSVDEFKENYKLKLIVEAFCCMEGAFMATQIEVNRIQAILDKIKLYRSPQYDKERLTLNHEFHELMVNCSHNKFLIEVYKKQTKKVGWSRYIPLIKSRMPKGNEEHIEIFSAFLKKDGELVRKLVERHQITAMEIISNSLKERAKWL